ncbi:UDP-forming cellulose synthase catalytic subunit [Crenobacter sp. SG2305]|uniref:UDP-forming cellulose synthase catalytic subunit n=1 Tax=Crenobacter oryzisoli TaxID=3056844 RepID=UPI0025AA3BC8|nr:UDP-forming cellulose synthase catalytic subunit [Crenobacter sp. SG2305]MDN0084377.1 UDP-forming cellulose synthase catalytic subunit [Crenobacter sp. SG2305]
MSSRWTRWLLASGAVRHPDDAASIGTVLLSLFLVAPPEGWHAWGRQARRFFPHVDFDRLRLSDALRIVLQCLWLLLVRRPGEARHGLDLRQVLPRERRRWSERRHLEGALRLYWLRFKAWAVRRFPALLDRSRLRGSVEHAALHPFWDHWLASYACYALAVLLAVVCITTPFDIASQALFVVLLLAMALWVRRVPGPVPTLILVVFSITVSTRYIWWRATSTINDDTMANLIAGVVLLCAELYAWVVLLLGFFQTSWMLRRKVVALPADPGLWPSVDVFIPTYNEPLRVLKPTIYAAQALDWPKDKLNVYILDDGSREEVRRFAEEIGVGYLIREQHNHAKAGNINHALTLTDGEFVAIFDCDHIPTRSFLQVTMGGFLGDEKLALVQTPHHFFSPDPFERNLNSFRKVPNENELFYGRVQDGNDLWNATFFCGSCAVLRRGPLEEIGGIAVETVTEDAHTSLKLHRRGYRSAYLNLVQAAGLATESLSAHIGQRIRWARGMTQIFRTDNPLFGKGLSLAQRICYSNAMLHFLYGIPRTVFLTAPLAFLLLHAYTIYAPAMAIVLYVLPHMIFATITNSRMHGQFRRSYWGEIYETVLAWYITLPTTIALLFPKLGKFNVTAKGGLVEESYFDWNITKPYLVLLSLNLLGLLAGGYRLVTGPNDELGTVLVNMAWTGYNLFLLGAALAVAKESRQVRVTHRVHARLPLTLHLPDGKCLPCHSSDYSEGGMAIVMPHAVKLAPDTPLHVSLRRSGRSFAFPCLTVFTKGNRLSLRFSALSRQQEMDLVQCTFGRADAWLRDEARAHEGTPMHGLRDIFRLGRDGFRLLITQALDYLDPLPSRLLVLVHRLATLLPRQRAPHTIQGKP